MWKRGALNNFFDWTGGLMSARSCRAWHFILTVNQLAIWRHTAQVLHCRSPASVSPAPPPQRWLSLARCPAGWTGLSSCRAACPSLAAAPVPFSARGPSRSGVQCAVTSVHVSRLLLSPPVAWRGGGDRLQDNIQLTQWLCSALIANQVML